MGSIAVINPPPVQTTPSHTSTMIIYAERIEIKPPTPEAQTKDKQTPATPTSAEASLMPVMSSKEINMIKELSEEVPAIEQRIDDLVRKINNIDLRPLDRKVTKLINQMETKVETDALSKEVERINDLFTKFGQLALDSRSSKEDSAKAKSRLDLLETKVSYMSKSLTDTVTKIERFSQTELGARKLEKQATLLNAGIGASSDDVTSMKADLEQLNKKVEAISTETSCLNDIKKKIQAFEQSLGKKLDAKLFDDWKQTYDINERIAALDKKFVKQTDIAETMKKIKSRLLFLEQEQKDTPILNVGENAMLAKKPLNGWKCASCEKVLTNIEGTKGQYFPWAKMPKMSTAERIAKVNITN